MMEPRPDILLTSKTDYVKLRAGTEAARKGTCFSKSTLPTVVFKRVGAGGPEN